MWCTDYRAENRACPSPKSQKERGRMKTGTRTHVKRKCLSEMFRWTPLPSALWYFMILNWGDLRKPVNQLTDVVQSQGRWLIRNQLYMQDRMQNKTVVASSFVFSRHMTDSCAVRDWCTVISFFPMTTSDTLCKVKTLFKGGILQQNMAWHANSMFHIAHSHHSAATLLRPEPHAVTKWLLEK